MTRIGIVTDSTAYLPDCFKERFQIEVVSLTINFEDESYPEEGLHNDFGRFYSKLRRISYIPTTSQPSIGDFVQAYERVAGRADSIISVHIAESVSGTVKTARAAARMLPQLDITVIDSMTTAVGLYMVIEAAVRAAVSFLRKEEVLQVMQYVIDHLTFLYVPATLEYLHRGGRVSGVAALLGNLLQIRPVLFFNRTRSNMVDLLEKVRTQEKGLQRILEEMRKQGPHIRLAAAHVAAEAQGQSLLQRVREIFPNLSPELFSVGPVVGAHTGPGMLGLCFYPLTPRLNRLFAP